MRAARSLVLLLGLAAAACSAERSESRTHLGTVQGAIIGGASSPAAQDAVVMLAVRPNGKLASTCTATLLAPNLIVTARHCVSDTDETVACQPDGTAVEGGAILGDHRAAELSIYRGTKGVLDLVDDGDASTRAAAIGTTLVVDGTNLCNHDVAFVVLDRSVDGPFQPLGAAPAKDASVTAVGWGITQSGALPTRRLQRAGMSVLAVGPGPSMGDAEIETGEGICSGDSGGPLLGADGGIVAVVSRGGGGDGPASNLAGGCIGDGTRNFYTSLAKKKALVENAYAAAGEKPWHVGEPSSWDGTVAPAPVAGQPAPETDAGEIDPALVHPDNSSRSAQRDVPADFAGTPAAAPPKATAEESSCAATPASRGSGTMGALVFAVACALRLRRRR